MAKFYGDIGFAIQEETKPGVWVNTILPRKDKGDSPHHKYQTTYGQRKRVSHAEAMAQD